MKASQSRNYLLIFMALLLFLPFSHSGMLWHQPSHFSDVLIGAPAITPSGIFALSKTGTVYSIDLSDGSAQAVYSIGSSSHVPMALGQSVLVFGADSGKIEARTLSKGNLAWQYPSQNKTIRGAIDYSTPGSQFVPVPVQENQSLRYLYASEGAVYAVYEKKLVALDELTGKEIFSARALSDGYSAGAGGGYIFVSDGDNLNAYSRDGLLLWSAMPGPLFKTRPVYDERNNIVYVAGTNGRLMAFDARSGNMRWNYPLNGWLMSTPITDGSLVLVGSNDGKVRAFESGNGNLAWEANAFGPVWGEPAMLHAGDRKIAVYGTNNNSLLAFDFADGTLLFNYQATDWVSSPSISLDGRTIAFFTKDSSAWAISAWPLCTIDYPRTGIAIPQEVEITGRAFSPSGAKIARIFINNDPLRDIVLNDTPTFSYVADLNGYPLNFLQIQCLAEDNDGLKEKDMMPSKSEPVLSLDAPRLNLSIVAYPDAISPSKQFTVYIRNAQGGDLAGVLFEMNGKNYSVSSPANISAPSQNGQYTLIARKAGYYPSTAYISVGSDAGIIPLVIIVILLLLCIGAFLHFSKKK